LNALVTHTLLACVNGWFDVLVPGILWNFLVQWLWKKFKIGQYESLSKIYCLVPGTSSSITCSR